MPHIRCAACGIEQRVPEPPPPIDPAAVAEIAKRFGVSVDKIECVGFVCEDCAWIGHRVSQMGAFRDAIRNAAWN